MPPPHRQPVAVAGGHRCSAAVPSVCAGLVSQTGGGAGGRGRGGELGCACVRVACGRPSCLRAHTHRPSQPAPRLPAADSQQFHDLSNLEVWRRCPSPSSPRVRTGSTPALVASDTYSDSSPAHRPAASSPRLSACCSPPLPAGGVARSADEKAALARRLVSPPPRDIDQAPGPGQGGVAEGAVYTLVSPAARVVAEDPASARRAFSPRGERRPAVAEAVDLRPVRAACWPEHVDGQRVGGDAGLADVLDWSSPIDIAIDNSRGRATSSRRRAGRSRPPKQGDPRRRRAPEISMRSSWWRRRRLVRI